MSEDVPGPATDTLGRRDKALYPNKNTSNQPVMLPRSRYALSYGIMQIWSTAMAPDSALIFYVQSLIDDLNFSDEELFNGWFHDSCLQLILAKNRQLATLRGKGWPENSLAEAVRGYINLLRRLRLN